MAAERQAKQKKAVVSAKERARKRVERRREATSEEPRPPTVTVFGASLAGMTAAHELAARGFTVKVVEKESDGKKGTDGEPRVAVGGIARTQFRGPNPFLPASDWYVPQPESEVPSPGGVREPRATDPPPVDPDQPTKSDYWKVLLTHPPGALPDAITLPLPDEKREIPADQMEKVVETILRWVKLEKTDGKYKLGTVDQRPGIVFEFKWATEPSEALTRSRDAFLDKLANQLDRLLPSERGQEIGPKVISEEEGFNRLYRGVPGLKHATVRLAPLFPAEIEFVVGRSARQVPVLSDFGSSQMDVIRHALSQFTSSYEKSEWIKVSIAAWYAQEWKAAAEYAVSLVAERLRDHARSVTKDPDHDLAIVRTFSLRNEVPPFGVRVDVEPLFPLTIQFDGGDNPTLEGAAHLELLAYAYPLLTQKRQGKRCLMWNVKGDQCQITFLERWMHGNLEKSVAIREELQAAATSAEVQVVAMPLPGEHRPMLVQPYYENLRGILKRIRLSDSSSKTAFDNIVLVDAGVGPRRTQQTGDVDGVIDLRSPKEFIIKLQDTPQDFAQAVLRLLRYGMTCKGRRETLERLSFWEYLEGRDDKACAPRYRYTDHFKCDLSLLCRLVTGVDAESCDARTAANMFLQLLRTQIRPIPESVGMFNGPTATAWLDPWRDYLERRWQVKFDLGELDSLEPTDATATGSVKPKMKEGTGPVTADYYILATGAQTAGRVTWKLDAGVPEQLSKWLGGPFPEKPPKGRLRTFGGLQYFFTTGDEAKLEEAVFCLRDFGWAVSVSTGSAFWKTHPTVKDCGCSAMVSVDIAAWDAPIGGFEADAKNMASDLSRSDLAKKIWSLIHAHIPWKLAYGAKAPTPRWCHIDDDIKDRSPSDQSFLNAGRIDVSAALYSVPQKGDWRDRPGTIAPEPDYQKKAKSDPTLWQPEDGGYAVHWGKLVFAGTYLKTLSRAPTLETACEAGLQAANAIARHYAATHSGKGPKLVDPPQRTSEWTFGDGSWEQKPRSAEPDGDSKPCEIWDPEENELPELMKLRKYDEECFKRELPHPWDLLGLELLPSLTSWLPASHRSLDPRLGWSNAGSDHQLQWTGEAYFRLVRAFREALEKKYSGTNEDSNSAPAGEE